MIDAEQLLTLLEVAEQGSITEAAKRMHRGQSAISERLRHLTDYVGEPLYERDGNGIRLTRFGADLMESIKRLKYDIADIDSIVKRRKSLLDGDLFIFSTNLITNYFLLPYVKKFITMYPHISINITRREGTSDHVPIGLFDIFFYEAEMPIKYLPNQFESNPWKEDEVCFIAEPNHPLAKEPVIDVSMLRDQTVVWRHAKSAIRSAMERQFKNAKISPKATIEVDDVESVGFMVQSGLGVGFLSERVVERRTDWNIVAVPLVNHDIVFTRYMSVPKTHQ
jgi:DNA-binding transcriptional LysR family regulator